jgi:hypothetical protein
MANRVGWNERCGYVWKMKKNLHTENFDQITSSPSHTPNNISIAIKLAKGKIGFFGYQNRTQ